MVANYFVRIRFPAGVAEFHPSVTTYTLVLESTVSYMSVPKENLQRKDRTGKKYETRSEISAQFQRLFYR